MSLRIRFRAVRENIPRVRSLIETLLAGDSEELFRTEDIDEICIGLQECLTNVVRHADPNDEERLVRLSVSLEGGNFEAMMSDRGRPFDANEVPIPDPQQPRENGYGIFLVRTTMDSVEFSRVGDVNQVKIQRRRRKLEAISGQPALVRETRSSRP